MAGITVCFADALGIRYLHSNFFPCTNLTMAMNVDSKTAIITGAGSGINFCFAKLLLSKGCNVVIADLALRPEAQELISRYPLTSIGAKAVFQKTDVTDWSQLEKMFQKAIVHFGGADIVCPGAGVYEPVSEKPPLLGMADIPTAFLQFLDPTRNRYIERYGL
jgi:NAD(P)-dependent dehydrogenase (short-subunit alcohol dehydrogenase family)